MNGNSNLAYLREAKRGLTSEQQDACDHIMLGIVSVHIPEQVWNDAVGVAVRLAKPGQGEHLQALVKKATK